MGLILMQLLLSLSLEKAIGYTAMTISMTQLLMGHYGLDYHEGEKVAASLALMPVSIYLGAMDTSPSDKNSLRIKVSYSKFSGQTWHRDTRVKLESRDFATTTLSMYFFPDRHLNLVIRLSKPKLVSAIKTRSGIPIGRYVSDNTTVVEALLNLYTPSWNKTRFFVYGGYDLSATTDLEIKYFSTYHPATEKNLQFYSRSIGGGVEINFRKLYFSVSYEDHEFRIPVKYVSPDLFYSSEEKFKFKVISGGIGYAF